jgi:superfamily II DNA or RNA helicase
VLVSNILKRGEKVEDYKQFIESKRKSSDSVGFEAKSINDMLFPFQQAIVKWAVKRGRAAIFADCGMGKTPMQLEWANQIYKNENLNVLILAPLAVAAQTVREGRKFHIEAHHARSMEDVVPGITVTNYEILHKFDLSYFGAIVLDESSILKSYMGKTKMMLLSAFKDYKYKLACTATPAPNDHMELGNHAEFLGVMPSNEMLSRWFINDTMQAGNYRLKGHGKKDFWRWVSSWAVSLRVPSDIGNYSDDGYVLPELKITTIAVEAPPPEGMLFHNGGTLSATEIHKEKRKSAMSRAMEAAKFARASEEQCIIWCDTNYEADAIMECLPEAIEVRGDHSDKQKEDSLLGFAQEKFKILISKSSVCGFGMNFQQCHRAVFVGLSYSFEALYQALRRTYRFGQKWPVECLIIESQAESGIRDVVFEKVRKHEEMQEEMCSDMKEFQVMGNKALQNAPEPTAERGKGWELWNGDCVQVLREKVEDNSIDFSIFSPPFANLYIYSDSIADMGNCSDYDEFFVQFDFLVEELYKKTVNGRLCSVHCKDLPAYKGRDGAAGLIDFPGALIKAFERRKWQYHSRVTIWKDPVIEMQRTKNHGLLHKQLCKDSSASRQGMADYLLTFRKWDGDVFPRPVQGKSKEVRFTEYVGEEPPEHVESDRHMSIQVWQRYASPVWFDIQQTKVLQGHRNATSEEDEKHICPLQLQVIERAIHLWSNKNDLVFSPFVGIGSEPYTAVSMGRRALGAELKEGYFKQAVKNMKIAEIKSKEQSLFDEIEPEAELSTDKE